MADYYRLAVQYPDGREVETVHKGAKVDRGIARRFKPLGMSAEIGDRLPEEAEEYWRQLDKVLFAKRALGWHPQMREEEGDDAGDD